MGSLQQYQAQCMAHSERRQASTQNDDNPVYVTTELRPAADSQQAFASVTPAMISAGVACFEGLLEAGVSSAYLVE
jgi:hypothetical protein